MDESELLLNHAGEVIALMAVGGGILIAVISVIACTIKGCVRSKQTEMTRREIAAYVAEGSITPEDGERLMRNAGRESIINKL